MGIAGVLLLGHGSASHHLLLSGWALTCLGVLAGVVIGVVASLLGVAGGELLIPTIVILFGADLKLAGSLPARGEPANYGHWLYSPQQRSKPGHSYPMALHRDYGSRVNRRQLPWRQAPRHRADTRALAIAGSNTPHIRSEGVAAFIGT